MKKEDQESCRRHVPRGGLAGTAAALAIATAAGFGGGPGHAALDQPSETSRGAVQQTMAAAPVRLAAAPAAAGEVRLPTNHVKVNDALLRSQPNRNSTKLDVAQRGRGVTIYCWHDYTDSSHFIWFRVHPWGSRYTGWMRGDLIHWGSYPNPGQC